MFAALFSIVAQLFVVHRLFYCRIDESNAGRYREADVYITGSDYLPPSWQRVPERMAAFMERMESEYTFMHPIEYAARAHYGLVSVHPFVDGNGRTARLLMNAILVRAGYGVVPLPPRSKGFYIYALQRAQDADEPDFSHFLAYIAEQTAYSLSRARVWRTERAIGRDR